MMQLHLNICLRHPFSFQEPFSETAIKSGDDLPKAITRYRRVLQINFTECFLILNFKIWDFEINYFIKIYLYLLS